MLVVMPENFTLMSDLSSAMRNLEFYLEENEGDDIVASLFSDSKFAESFRFVQDKLSEKENKIYAEKMRECRQNKSK